VDVCESLSIFIWFIAGTQVFHSNAVRWQMPLMNPNEWQTLTKQFTTLTPVWRRELKSKTGESEK